MTVVNEGAESLPSHLCLEVHMCISARVIASDSVTAATSLYYLPASLTPTHITATKHTLPPQSHLNHEQMLNWLRSL